MSRPGTARIAVRQPSAASVIGTGAVPQRPPGRVLDDEVRRRPEAVLVERVAADRQRVVDPDRLARDLLAVLVDREVGREVASPGRCRSPGASKSRFFTSSSPGVPIGWTVSDSPSGDDQALLVAEPRGHGRGDQEQDQPGVGEQRRHLRVLVAVAVQEASCRRRRSPRGRGNGCAAGRPRTSVGRRRPSIAARSGSARVEVRLGLGDADVADAAPQLGRPVERADDDRDHEHGQPGAEPRRAEDR